MSTRAKQTSKGTKRRAIAPGKKRPIRRKYSARTSDSVQRGVQEDGNTNVAGAKRSGKGVSQRGRTANTDMEFESKFRIVADNTYDWEFWLSPTERFLYCSPSCERITGHTSEEFIADPGLRRKLIHPEDVVLFDRHQRTVEHRRAQGEDEWRFHHADGTWRWIAHVCQPVYGENGKYLGCRGSNRDITERKRSEEAQRRGAERNRLLADVTARLLGTEHPQIVVEDLCRAVMEHLHCQCFFNFLVDEESMRLHLNACGGISLRQQKRMEWLDFGVAVCGTVARDGVRIVAERIQESEDPMTEMVRGLGIQAYACHPLKGQDKVVGTLSFGAKDRATFTPEELSLMQSVADQVAVSMQRMNDKEEIRRSRDELEIRVGQRTADLNVTLDALQAERKRFRDVLDRLPAYVVLLTEDYRVALVNEYFAERFGKSDGRRCYESLFGKTEPCENCQSFTVLKTNAPNKWEWDGPDGHIYDVTDFPFTDVDGSRLVLEMGIDITDRKKAEEQVRNANRYHRSLIEASLDPLVTIDAAGKITDVNAATERVTGCARQDLIGDDFSNYFTDADRARAGYQKVFRDGSVQDFPLEIRHKSGHETPVLYNASLFANDAGEVVGVFAAARDITDRRQAELQLRRTGRALKTLGRCNEVLVHAESESELLNEICRVIVEEGGYRLAWVGFADSDADKSVRPVAYAGFEEGYLDRARITWADTERGRGPTGTAIRTGRPAMTRNMLSDPSFAPWKEDAIKRGYASSLVLPLKSNATTFGALSIYAVEPDAFNVEEMSLLTELADDLSFGIMALRDHAELERTEEAFRRASAYNRSLLEASLDPLVTIGVDGIITDVNAATLQATGRSREELLGTDFSGYFTEPEKAREGYEQVFREGLVRDFALELRHRDGHVMSVLYNASLYQDSDGKPIGVFAAARDVTERKHAEEELVKYRNHLEDLVGERTAQLEYANKELEAFAYSVSHDLRAPLRHIDGFIELLAKEMGPTISQKGAQYVQTISDSAKRMANLIDDLLSFSRMSRQEMHSSQVDMARLVREVIEESAGEVQGRTIRWKVAPLPTMTADKAMMKIVLANIISNAQKFTRTRDCAEIEIGTMPSGQKETIFYVRDNGVGFEMEYVHKLFNVFQRLHSAREFEGTGIGLANVRRIIDRHGGRTWAESTVNAGATVYFSLPQSEEGT